MDKIYLFAYGTLQFDYIQLQVLGMRLPRYQMRKIHHYKIGQLIIEDIAYVCAVPTDNYDEFILGNIYEIEESDLSLLDEFETDAYERVIVTTIDASIVYMYIKRNA